MLPLPSSIATQAFFEAPENRPRQASVTTSESEARRKLLSGDWAREQSFIEAPLFPELLSGVSYSQVVLQRKCAAVTVAVAKAMRIRHPEFFSNSDIDLVDRSIGRSQLFFSLSLLSGAAFAAFDHRKLFGRPFTAVQALFGFACMSWLAYRLCPYQRVVNPLLQLSSPAGAMLRGAWTHAPAVANDLGYTTVKPSVSSVTVTQLLAGLGDVASVQDPNGVILPGDGSTELFVGRGDSLKYLRLPESLGADFQSAARVNARRHRAVQLQLQDVEAVKQPSRRSFLERFRAQWAAQNALLFLPAFLPWRYADFDVDAAIASARRPMDKRRSGRTPRHPSPLKRTRELPRGVSGEDASLLRAEDDRYRFSTKAPSWTLLPQSWREKKEDATLHRQRIV